MERREKIVYGEDKAQRRGVQSQHKPARTPVAKSGAISYYSVDFRKWKAQNEYYGISRTQLKYSI